MKSDESKIGVDRSPNRSLLFALGLTEEELHEDEQKYPLKRYGRPEDIAHLAVYLLSDAASWMAGSNVKITGGAR